MKLPLVLSMLGSNPINRHGRWHHVICIRRSQIIEFEYDRTYLVTIPNLHYACGKDMTFSRIVCGYVSMPGKELQDITCLKHDMDNKYLIDNFDVLQNLLLKIFRGRE